MAANPATAKIEDDPYLWLEEVDGARALEWVEEWNRRTKAELASGPEFAATRDRALEILNSRDRIAAPSQMGDYIYNFWQDAEHVRGVWRRTTLEDYLTEDPDWEVVLDVDALADAEGENWVFKGASCLYPDYRRCMIQLSRGGGDAAVQREFDTVARRFVEGGFTLTEAKSRTSWRDADSLWVGTDFGPGSLTESGYPRSARLWRRGEPLERARTVFEGEVTDVSVSAFSVHTPEGRYDLVMQTPAFFRGRLFLLLGGRLVRLDIPEDADFREIFKDRLVFSLRSDWEVGGRRYRPDSLLAIQLDELLLGSTNFELLFEPSERVSLSRVARTRDSLLLTTLDNVRGRIYRLTPGGQGWVRKRIELPENGTVGISSTSIDSNAYFASFADYLTPSSLYFVENGETRLVKQLPAYFDSAGLEVHQHEAVSRDGTRIPYFLVHRKGLQPDGSSPTLLYGYGGFEIPMVPHYSGLIGSAWLEKGGVYAVANIRGGGEFGPAWHQAALKENRHRAYEDFIAVAEDLVRRKITSPNHLGIQGGSNGGLLVGAAFTMRPDLFGAVVCQVPLLDMKRYTKLLAGASWAAEYGDPDDPEMWEYIRTYSPYHNVSNDAKYPRVLFMTSTRDDRVHPGHARKMVARMAELGHPVYYYENTEGGHSAAANNEQRAYMYGLLFSYLWQELGTE